MLLQMITASLAVRADVSYKCDERGSVTLAALDQRHSLFLELRGVLLLRNPFHLFPPVNVNATHATVGRRNLGKLTMCLIKAMPAVASRQAFGARWTTLAGHSHDNFGIAKRSRLPFYAPLTKL